MEIECVTFVSMLRAKCFDAFHFVRFLGAQPGDLLRHHGLRFVTSSVHIKAREEKAAMEKAAREKAALDEAAAKESARIKELEDSLATSESSSTKEVDAEKQTRRFPFMRKAKIPVESTAYQLESLTSPVPPMDDTGEFCMECKAKLEALHDAELPSTTPDTAKIPAGNEDLKQSAPADVQPSHSCPCEWFICDDELSKIRNFSIQVCRDFSTLAYDSAALYLCTRCYTTNLMYSLSGIE